MVVMRGDGLMSADVRGTALDVLANTEYLIVGGSNQISLYLMGSSSTSTITKIRTNRSLVRLLKFNPVIATGRFASVSGQYIDIYTLGQHAQIQQLASFTAQNRKVSDFCWCPHDEQLMISCGESDYVNCWDLRVNLTKPTFQVTAA
uniref:Uncharacterized protein n=2 Tax=Meloidogyne TaxID=189290 RepID=A0A6V7VP64_MELEN|nr:unnamed protein product [Meloidogyne enterolobii]